MLIFDLKKADAVLRFYVICIFTFRHAEMLFMQVFPHLDDIRQPLIFH